MSKALFARYRWGLQNLMEALGSEHPRITAVRILQQHLIENLNDPAAREDILHRLNQLCIELTGKPFERFCELGQPQAQQKPATSPLSEALKTTPLPATP